jgi:hypothetical protein
MEYFKLILKLPCKKKNIAVKLRVPSWALLFNFVRQVEWPSSSAILGLSQNLTTSYRGQLNFFGTNPTRDILAT